MQATTTTQPGNGLHPNPAQDAMLRGDPARYGQNEPGKFAAIMGRPSPEAYARLIDHMQKAAQHQRLAQNAAVACGLGGSELETALNRAADDAESLFGRVQPALFLQAQ